MREDKKSHNEIDRKIDSYINFKINNSKLMFMKIPQNVCGKIELKDKIHPPTHILEELLKNPYMHGLQAFFALKLI